MATKRAIKPVYLAEFVSELAGLKSKVAALPTHVLGKSTHDYVSNVKKLLQLVEDCLNPDLPCDDDLLEMFAPYLDNEQELGNLPMTHMVQDGVEVPFFEDEQDLRGVFPRQALGDMVDICKDACTEAFDKCIDVCRQRYKLPYWQCQSKCMQLQIRCLARCDEEFGEDFNSGLDFNLPFQLQ